VHFGACGTSCGTFPHEANGAPPQTVAGFSEFPPPPFCMKSQWRLSLLTYSLLRSSPKLHHSVPETTARLVLSNVSLHAHACRFSSRLILTCSSRCQISVAIIPGCLLPCFVKRTKRVIRDELNQLICSQCCSPVVMVQCSCCLCRLLT